MNVNDQTTVVEHADEAPTLAQGRRQIAPLASGATRRRKTRTWRRRAQGLTLRVELVAPSPEESQDIDAGLRILAAWLIRSHIRRQRQSEESGQNPLDKDAPQSVPVSNLNGRTKQ